MLATLSLPVSARGQAIRECQLGVVAVAARRSFVGGELGVAARPGEARLGAGLALGTWDRAPAVRATASAEFLLAPWARAGTSLSGGLGVAALLARGRPGAGYLTATVGIEAAPRARRGWYLEAGVGGGVHAAAGVRWRRLPAGW